MGPAALAWVFWHLLPPALPYQAPLPTWWNRGRIVTTSSVHVGVRPAADLGDMGVGVTVQITVKTPW